MSTLGKSLSLWKSHLWAWNPVPCRSLGTVVDQQGQEPGAKEMSWTQIRRKTSSWYLPHNFVSVHHCLCLSQSSKISLLHFSLLNFMWASLLIHSNLEPCRRGNSDKCSSPTWIEVDMPSWCYYVKMSESDFISSFWDEEIETWFVMGFGSGCSQNVPFWHVHYLS